MLKNLELRKTIAIGVLFAFLSNGWTLPEAQADDFYLPAPGVMVRLSPGFNPPILKGIKVHSDNPFRFEFILDTGDSRLSNGQLKQESAKLIKYFLASITIPEKDLWVNLSPYEKDRIIPQSFGLTEMGRDLLAEDYLLKQITAGLTFPKDGIGKKFWRRIYEEAYREFGTTNFTTPILNKVWIMPEKAVVYENTQSNTAYVIESRLKVMLDEDYLAYQKHQIISSSQNARTLASRVARQIIIPELTKEVNEGLNFAKLRQVYNSLILATWYKKKIKEGVLNLVYSNQNKVAGININDPKEKEKIYRRYIQAFKKGAYNFIEEDRDPITKQPEAVRYFSGGVTLLNLNQAMTVTRSPKFLSSIARSTGILLLLATSLNVAKAAQFSEKTYPWGYATKVAVTQQGDTLPKLTKEFIISESQPPILDKELLNDFTTRGSLDDLFNPESSKHVIKEDEVWNTLLKKGMIDSKGFIQRKYVRSIRTLEDFRKMIGPMSQDLSERLYYEFYIEIQLDLDYSLTKDERKEILERLQSENPESFDKGRLVEGKTINLDAAREVILAARLSKSKDVVSKTKVDIDGRPVEVYFLDTGEPLLQGMTMAKVFNHKIFLNVRGLMAIMKGLNFSDLESYKKTLNDLIREEISHELRGRASTNPLITKGLVRLYPQPVTELQFKATVELSGLMAEIVESNRPDKPLLIKLLSPESEDMPQEYHQAVKIIKGAVLKEYKERFFEWAERELPEQNKAVELENGDLQTIDDNVAVEFLKTISVDEQKQAVAKFHKEVFGVALLPLPQGGWVSDELLKHIEKNYETVEAPFYTQFKENVDQISDIPSDSVYYGVIKDLTDQIKSGDSKATARLIQLSKGNDNLGRLCLEYMKFLTFKDIAPLLANSFDQELFDYVYNENPNLFEKTSYDQMKAIYLSLNIPNAESAYVETVGYLYAHHYAKDTQAIGILLEYANKGYQNAAHYLLLTPNDYSTEPQIEKKPIDLFREKFDFTNYIQGLDLKEQHFLFRDLVKSKNLSVIEFLVQKAKDGDDEAWSILVDDSVPGYFPEKEMEGLIGGHNFNSFEGIELLGNLLKQHNTQGTAILFDLIEKKNVRALEKVFELSFADPSIEERLKNDRTRISALFSDKKSLVDLLYVYLDDYLNFYKAPVDENDIDSVLFYVRNMWLEKKAAERYKYFVENRINPLDLEQKYLQGDIERLRFEEILDALIQSKNRDAFLVLTRQARNDDLTTFRPIVSLAEGKGPFAQDAQEFLKTFQFLASASKKGWEFEALINLASAIEYGNQEAIPLFKDLILKEEPTEVGNIVRSGRGANGLVAEVLSGILAKNDDPQFLEQCNARFGGEQGFSGFLIEQLIPEGVSFAFQDFIDMARKGTDGLDQTIKTLYFDSRKWNQENIGKISKINFVSLLRPADAKNIYIDLFLRRLAQLGIGSAAEALKVYGFINDYSPQALTKDNLDAQYHAAEDYLNGLKQGGFKEFVQTIGPYDLPTMKRFMIKFYSSILIVENTKVGMLDLEQMNHLLSLVPYLVEIETNYDNADNSLDIGYYFIKNVKDFEELFFVLGHEQGHNILNLLLGRDFFSEDENTIDPGLHEGFGDLMGMTYVLTPGESLRILRSYASKFQTPLTKKDFEKMEGHDQARSLEMMLLSTAGDYGINGEEILRQLARNSKKFLKKDSKIEKTFYQILIQYFSSTYGKRPIPIPVGENIGANMDKIFSHYVKRKKRPAKKSIPNVAAQNGGIDFTVINGPLKIQNEGQEIKLTLNPATILRLKNAPGFVPVIISIRPMADLKLWLDINDKLANSTVGI